MTAWHFANEHARPTFHQYAGCGTLRPSQRAIRLIGRAPRTPSARCPAPRCRSAPDRVADAVPLESRGRLSAGTRASQYLVLGGKTRALLQGRPCVSFDDIRALAQPVFRHRILLNYRAEAEGIGVGHVIDRLLEAVVPPGGK